MSRLQAQPPPKVLWLCLDESNTHSSLVVVIQTSGHMAILKPVSFLCHLCLFALCLNYMSNMTGADYSSRAPVFTSGFWWGPVLLITLREHLCSPPFFDGVRCCSCGILLFFMDIGTGLTVWYFVVFLLDFGTVLAVVFLELFWQCGIFRIVPTVWYF